ncbi:MAG: V-type ATP synthase alpha chain [Chlamydiia bacterium]|nr:V-type ATP synthase alpha chain [Chlamydiia bacterium]
MITQDKDEAVGKVISANGNLIEVVFDCEVSNGEVGLVELDEMKLKCEVLEFSNGVAKMQVFESLSGVKLNQSVVFTRRLLSAELGPGLLGQIIDGLQNPLPMVKDKYGDTLPRGADIKPLDREKKWEFRPLAKVGDRVHRGVALGETDEERFCHKIMVPFSQYGEYTVTWVAEAGSYTVDSVIAKGKNDRGNEFEWTMIQYWPIKRALFEGTRKPPKKLLTTGLRIIDSLFPVLCGGTACCPGPFGAGKTVLQHQVAKYSNADIVIMVACGERAGEVVEVIEEFPHLTDPHTEGKLMERSMIVCNTSNMPVAAREASVYLGITVAEYYRQMGISVVLLADSTSRWAQALREMSGRMEEMPGDEGFCADLKSLIARFYERSGCVETPYGEGAVTMIGAVSPAGGNFEEPVTQSTLSVVSAFFCLSRARSDARRYPALDPLDSWSKYRYRVAKVMEHEHPGWGENVEHALAILRQGNLIGKRMEVIGEESTSIGDFIIYLKSEFFDFTYLQQNAFNSEDAYCSFERMVEVFGVMNMILRSEVTFLSTDEARSFFMSLQNLFINMNFSVFGSDEYNNYMKEIKTRIESASNVRGEDE